MPFDFRKLTPYLPREYVGWFIYRVVRRLGLCTPETGVLCRNKIYDVKPPPFQNYSIRVLDVSRQKFLSPLLSEMLINNKVVLIGDVYLLMPYSVELGRVGEEDTVEANIKTVM